MSIPGLGQIPDQPAATSTTRTIPLRPGSEYRFTAPLSSPLTIRLTSGTAEKDGTELAPGQTYTFTAVHAARILTWQGCELEVSGRTEREEVKSYASPAENPASAWLNLHAKLQDMRETAGREGREGPRVLVAGGQGVGKTALARTVTAYATRKGEQPLVVNTDPKNGMLSLPGSLSAAVFATVMDLEAGDGWGTTPASGPSAVPVKLPLAYSLGRKTWKVEGTGEDGGLLFQELVSRLAGRVSERLSEDGDVKRAGVIIDTPAAEGEDGVEMLAHVIDEFSVNIVIVLGSSSLASTLATRFNAEKTSLGEPVQIIPLDGLYGPHDSAGAIEETWAQNARERIIKEYFFGGGKRTLSPQIQQVDFDAIVAYRYGDAPDSPLLRAEVSSMLEHWTLAVMNASTRDSPDTIRAASVMGYVYIADVDEEKRKLRVLAPVTYEAKSEPKPRRLYQSVRRYAPEPKTADACMCPKPQQAQQDNTTRKIYWPLASKFTPLGRDMVCNILWVVLESNSLNGAKAETI
ncbi:mRNA cleavage and polyadenylation factor CLP1 p-loop domain-containing protein [Sarocladium implicatum]|nr:mRNA cleavage and polyadenylation factor CLP1 p-loop domain-containing protein [Sarocladium implicatum]